MAVLIVLFGALFLYRTLGALGLSLFATWVSCARYGLATMFAFTAVSHFAPMKKDLIAMVPPGCDCLGHRNYETCRGCRSFI